MTKRTAVALLMCFVVSMTAGAQEPAQLVQHAAIPQSPHNLMAYLGPAKCQPATIDASLLLHKMPDVVGCMYEEKLAKIFRKFDDGIPKSRERFSNAPVGQIVEQTPDPASSLPSDKPITLTLSKGPDPQLPAAGPFQPPAAGSTAELPPPPNVPLVAVPEVVGFAVSDAQTAITIEGQLRAVSGGEESSPRQPGTVTRTEPPAHTQVEQGTIVTYWISSGPDVVPPAKKEPKNLPVSTTRQPPQVRVPLVEGMTLSQATFALNKAGLVPGKPSYEFSRDEPGFVSRQQPSFGAYVDRGAPVSLWLPSPWFSPMSVAAGLLVALTAGGVGLGYGYRRYRIARTRRLLQMKPSLAGDSETRFVLALQMDGPATTLRVRLEVGEVLFGAPLPIERQETNHA